MILDLIERIAPAVGWDGAFARLGLALLLGGILGIDREMLGKAAGVRTLALVCAGSATFMMLAEELARQYTQATQYDPSRLAAGVIQGIGFLGAGSIIHAKGHIEGVTTAATIWFVAGIGLCLGAGAYGLAWVAFLAALVALLVMRVLKWPIVEARDGESSGEA